MVHQNGVAALGPVLLSVRIGIGTGSMVPRRVTCHPPAAPRVHPRSPFISRSRPSRPMALEADLAKMSERVCSHMNHDHANSLLAWAHFYAKVPDAASVGAQQHGQQSGFVFFSRYASSAIQPAKNEIWRRKSAVMPTAANAQKVASAGRREVTTRGPLGERVEGDFLRDLVRARAEKTKGGTEG